MPSLIEFTPSAITKLKQIMAEQQAQGDYLRVVAKPTEQGGVTYDFGLAKQSENDDEVVDGDIKVLVDGVSVGLLRGSKIDYIETLERSGFMVENPNVKSGCACGGGGCGCSGAA